MVHGYNTQGKKQEPVIYNQEDQIKSMEDNIVSSINSLKDGIINLKEIVIKNLQDENEKLSCKFEHLEKRCANYESDNYALAQYV